MNERHARAGFAMPAAIAAVVIIGVLVTAGFFMAQQEMRMGVATENAGLAFLLAERGAAEVLDAWDNDVLEATSLFTATTFTGTTPEGTWSVDVYRTGTRSYFLDSSGQVTLGGAVLSGAERRIGIIARHLELGIEPPAAVTAKGGIAFKGSPPTLIGGDIPPPSWGTWGTSTVCTAYSQTDQIGFLSNDTTGTIKGGTGKAVDYCGIWIHGSPCVEEDIPLVDETFDPFYDADYWDYLTDLAVDSLPPGNYSPVPTLSGADCNYDDMNNWGSIVPTHACGSYFPMFYIDATGTSAALTGAFRGQGILLVDGDLDLGGTGIYVGIIVVRGTVRSSGTPSIYGALIANAVDVIQGTPTIQYSQCAVDRAIIENENVTRARPLTNRGFIDMSSVGN